MGMHESIGKDVMQQAVLKKIDEKIKKYKRTKKIKTILEELRKEIDEIPVD